MLGKVDLPPVPGAAQLPDPLTRRRTDVLCHASMIGLAFALYLAHTLFTVARRHERGKSMRARFLGPCVALALLMTVSGVWAQSTPATPATDAQSIATLNEQAANGDAKAQLNLCNLYHNGHGAPQDDTQAAVWCRKAADQGDAGAQFHLAWFYAHGQGVPQDYPQAAVWYRKAADQGDAKAQTMLGGLYHQGQGVGLDYSEAAIWFRKAAEQGFPDAQFKLGYAYLKGEGVPQDYAQAAVWYRKAAEQGHGEAQHNLGVLYAKGQGVAQDYAQAAVWYHKAADQGLGKAQIELGRLYRNGQGVPQDNAQAAIWFRKAADQGIADEQNSLGGPSSQSASSGTRVVICQNDEVLAPGWSSNCAHVWLSGYIVKVMRSNGVLVAVAMQDTGKYFMAQVSVVNKTASPLDVLPQSFSSMVLRPHPKTLGYLPPDKVIRSISNSAVWSNFFTALGAAGATQQSVTQSTTNGTASAYGTGGSAYGRYSENTTSVTSVPDQQAQQDAANRIAANNAAVSAASQEVSAGSFQPTTVAPGKSVTGNVYFEHARKIETSEVLIPVNGEVFDFHFEWK
jgi:TPR repeat protein